MLLRLDQIDLLKFGHTIQMAGAIYIGEGKVFLALFPDETGVLTENYTYRKTADGEGFGIYNLQMDRKEWEKFLHQTDLLETEILTKASDGTLTKAIARKSQRQISQAVSWAVYKRDGYRCRYCSADDVPLTVDHLVLWEEGGPSIESNLVSCCRKDNRARGNLPFAKWLKHPRYFEVSKRLSPEVRAANEALVAALDDIPRVLHQRSR